MNVGRIVKTLRVSMGWQQTYLAEKLNLSASYLCLIEAGKRVPSSEIFEDVAKVFDISLDALIFLSTAAPRELDEKSAGNYRKLQGSMASLLLLQGGKKWQEPQAVQRDFKAGCASRRFNKRASAA
jgi:transcriptional regulator with XRE-family HTH domain